MINCTVCGTQIPPGAAFCDNCGTPTDSSGGDEATAVGSAMPPHQGGHGGYGGPQGSGGFDQGGYGQGGYDQGGYGGGYGSGGYANGGFEQPGGSSGGKGKWIAVWSALAVVLIAGIVTAVVLATSGGDDDADAAGGGDTSETTDEVSTEPTELAEGEVALGQVAEYTATRDEFWLEFEAERDQIVIIASEDALDYSLYSPVNHDASVFTNGWYVAGVFAYQVPRSGPQEIEIESSIDTAEIFVDVIDAEDLNEGDEVEIAEGKPYGAALYNLDGIYEVDEGLVLGSCSESPCGVSQEVIGIAAEEGLAPHEVAAASAEFESGGTSADYAMPAGGGGVNFTVTEGGALVVSLENRTDGEVDFRLRVLESDGTEVCDADSAISSDENCFVELEPGTYQAQATQYSDDASATGDVTFHLRDSAE